MNAETPANIRVADGLALVIQNRDGINQIDHEFTSFLKYKMIMWSSVVQFKSLPFPEPLWPQYIGFSSDQLDW
jgi:hypothetical protein